MLVKRWLFIVLLICSNAFSQPLQCDDYAVWGLVEKVTLPESAIVLSAKLDTGAVMSSLSATNIQTFSYNDKKWVRFRVGNVIFVKPIIRTTHIVKRYGELHSNERPVINLQIQIGKFAKYIDVNLIDRSNFKYPLLIGASALKKFHVLVNVEKEYLA